MSDISQSMPRSRRQALAVESVSVSPKTVEGMLVREAEQRPRSERDRALDDQRVMTIPQWCEVNGFSLDTGRRLIKAGKGPVITQVSDRRVGITVGNNRAWQQSRARSNAALP
jgi:hypothetical protein